MVNYKTSQNYSYMNTQSSRQHHVITNIEAGNIGAKMPKMTAQGMLEIKFSSPSPASPMSQNKTEHSQKDQLSKSRQMELSSSREKQRKGKEAVLSRSSRNHSHQIENLEIKLKREKPQSKEPSPRIVDSPDLAGSASNRRGQSLNPKKQTMLSQ